MSLYLAGYISITENDWRIYSTELFLLKEQQMQLLDTLMITSIICTYLKING
jgi:hypothetical protein